MCEVCAAQRIDGECAFPVSAPLSARVATVAFEIPGNSTTPETITVGGARTDALEVAGDEDWFRLTLAAGQSVTIELTGTGAAPLSDPFLWLYDSSGTLVAFDDDGGPGLGSFIQYTAPASATYFVAADSYGGLYAGDYRLAVAPVLSQADSIPGSTATRESIALGGTAAERIDYYGDADWFRLSLSDGQAALLDVSGTGSEPLDDPVIRVYDPAGRLLHDFDDGSGPSSTHRFVAPAGGTYFVEIASYANRTIGDYVLSATETDPPRLVDSVRGVTRLDTADPVLVYFSRAGDTYSVDGTTYTAAGFNDYETDRLWSVFEGIESFAAIDFERTTDRGAADIEWGSTDTGGSLLGFFMFPDSSGDGGFGLLNDTFTGWSDSPGGGLDAGGFMYGVAIHEIGHALGLGHTHDSGNGSVVMNGVASTTDLGDFELNQTVFTAMSYNDGWRSNPDGRPGTYNYGYSGTFGAIDIAALQETYGANTASRGGDDVYTLAGGNAPGTGYAAIWDTGGTDEIRHGGAGDAIIDLRAATLEYGAGGGGFISRVSGVFGGFTIAAGAIIENARAGAGADVLTGNAADNVLIGGDGADTLAGGGGADRLEGGPGNDRLTGGNGADTFRFGAGDGDDRILDFEAGIDLIDLLRTGTPFGQLAISDGTGGAVVDYAATASGTTSRIELVGVAAAVLSEGDFLTAAAGPSPITGTASADRLVGTDGDDELQGLGGNDALFGGRGNDLLFGGTGDDTLEGGAGADSLDGGAGIDTLSYAGSSAAIAISLQTGYARGSDAQGDRFSGFEAAIGSAQADAITGSFRDETIEGRAGGDTLQGAGGFDTLSYAGSAAGIAISLQTGYARGGDAQGDRFSGFEAVIGSAQADAITGSFRDETIEGGAGGDTLQGAGGFDTLSYAGSSAAIAISLQTGYARGGDAQGDRFSGFEAAIASAHADAITGSFRDETIEGGAGGDTLQGAGGVDLLSYAGSAAGIAVSLQTGYARGGDAQGDRFSGFEGAIGSAHADAITGSFRDETIEGGAGDDRIQGADGQDTMDGGLGSDMLSGGSAADTFEFTGIFGQDRITDFEDDLDRIVFRDAGTLTSPADAGADAVYTFVSGAVLIVENHSVAALADDIIFA